MNRKILAQRILRIAKKLIADDTSDSKFKVGDLVWLGSNKRTVYKITKVKRHDYKDQSTGEDAHWYNYDATNLRNGKLLSSASEDDFIPVGSKIIDKLGRDAATAAFEEFGKNGKVVVDLYRTTMEVAGEILNIGPNGALRVQTFIPGEALDIEHFKADFQNKDEVTVFKPSLYRGEWTWSNGSQNISKKFDGAPLTRLLD